MVETKVIDGNVWSKVVEKFILGLGAGIASLVLTYGIEFLQNEDLSSLPTWFLAAVPLLTAILIAAQNAWAHREKVVEITSEVK